ncbi:hypothetical protein D3C85_1369390 [compost metagenome]
MPAHAAVQRDAHQSQGVDAKAEGAIGISRLEVEHETLGPLCGFRRRGRAVTVVIIEVEVAHPQSSFAVTQEVRVGLAAECNSAQCNRYRRLVCAHVYRPFFL